MAGSNAENLLVVRDKELASRYVENWHFTMNILSHIDQEHCDKGVQLHRGVGHAPKIDFLSFCFTFMADLPTCPPKSLSGVGVVGG